MSVSVKKNDVVSFKYASGTNPGAVRYVVVDEVRGYQFSGRDLEKDGGDNFRNYNNSSVSDLKVLGDFSKAVVSSLDEVKRTFGLPAVPGAAVAAGLVQLYNPEHTIVPVRNGVLILAPVKQNNIQVSVYDGVGKAAVKLTNKQGKTMYFTLSNTNVSLEGVETELKTLFTKAANFLSA